MSPAMAFVALYTADANSRGRAYSLVTDGSRYEYYRQWLLWEGASRRMEAPLIDPLITTTSSYVWATGTTYGP